MGILVISSAGMLLTRLRRAFLGMCVGACEILLSLSVEQKVKAVSKFKDKVRKIFFTYSLIRQTQTKTPLLRIRGVWYHSYLYVSNGQSHRTQIYDQTSF